MFDGNFRGGVDKTTAPVGEALARSGVTADMLTVLGVIASVVAGLLIVNGYLALGFFAVVLGALPDLLDGPVAKALGASSKRGAFFDSFSDRVSDLILFGAVGWYFLNRGDKTMALVAFASYGAASLISYQRAKAESLGFDAKGGFLERAERLALLSFGLLLGSFFSWVLVFILLGSLVTVGQRFVKIWRQATVQLGKGATMPSWRSHSRRPRSSRASQRRRSGERVRYRLTREASARPGPGPTQGLIRRFRDGAGS